MNVISWYGILLKVDEAKQVFGEVLGGFCHRYVFLCVPDVFDLGIIFIPVRNQAEADLAV